ncbi:dapper homolog 2 [Halichoeres trimaculatus]|uniref:dapper homolog 2 n=1 Tax=Halichoeres trimaculatus TaxID=147232 RepID=UPI003D9F5B0D
MLCTMQGLKRSCTDLINSGPGLMRSGLDTMNSRLDPMSCGPALMRRGSDSRVAERLQAALAGLQELHLLKDRQRELVSRALRGDHEDLGSAVCLGPESSGRPGSEEHHLDATLTALKQQLSRLRKQDLGLKSHLQQLDQQISELKLDVRKASTEKQESDSRPSSGFYELSDGDSLSNSCTSVYSECLSSSQSSLRPLSPSLTGPLSQPDVCRRHSADETSAQPPPPRASGLHLGSSWIRTSSTELGRQRPVSTGDLDGILAQGLGCYKPMEPKKSLTQLRTRIIDPKYQSNLMSCEGAEVYQYPSPLHAVALQSPIYLLRGNPTLPGTQKVQGPIETSSASIQRKQMGHETKALGHMDKLHLHPVNRVQIKAETVLTHKDQHQESFEGLTMFSETSQGDCSGPEQASKTIPAQRDQKRHCMTYSREQITGNRNQTLTVRPPQGPSGVSCPSAVSSDEVWSSSLKKTKGHQKKVQGSDKTCEDHQDYSPQRRRGQRQRSGLNHSTRSGDPHIVSPQFVHAKFVPAGSQKIKVRQADQKTRALKLRRPHAARQQHSEKSRETRSKGEQKRQGREKLTQKYSNCHQGELRPGSSSDSSPCSPGLSSTYQIHKRYPLSPTRCSTVKKPYSQDSDLPIDIRRRKADLTQTSCAQRQQPRFRSQVQPLGSLQSELCARPGQCTGPPHFLQSSVSLTSFHHSLNNGYPSVACYRPSLNPPRCESEYSADCSSLYHSTVTGSSEGGLSNDTTNRFGDSESSWSSQTSSVSDSSLSLDQEDQQDCFQDQRDLLLVQAGVQQAPHHGPSACRIKASRALKKKIRRFQPASLKVMTLV